MRAREGVNRVVISKFGFLILVSLLFLTGGTVANAQAASIQQESVSIGEIRLIPATKKLCGAPSNPWGYNFCGGRTIRNPSSDFCGTFLCMKNFNRGRGYVVQCRSGSFSKSGGISGACSWHGGVSRTLYR